MHVIGGAWILFLRLCFKRAQESEYLIFSASLVGNRLHLMRWLFPKYKKGLNCEWPKHDRYSCSRRRSFSAILNFFRIYHLLKLKLSEF